MHLMWYRAGVGNESSFPPAARRGQKADLWSRLPPGILPEDEVYASTRRNKDSFSITFIEIHLC